MKDDNENEVRKKSRILVTHGTGVYDVTKFAEIHPGGDKHLKAFNKKDITNAMDTDSHRHSPYALRWLSEYRVGFAADYPDFETPKTEPPKYDGFVDWTKPLFWEVGNLKEKYTEWMTIPTDRPLRLFKNDFCEYFSNNSWYIVPIVWFPVAAYFSYRCYASGVNLLVTALLFLVGIGWWTLTEYLLHRFIFHLEPYKTSGIMSNITDNKYWITFHFLMHGQHHKVPFDKGRLVFPLVPAAVLVLAFRALFQYLSGDSFGDGLMGGGVFGYVCYDLIHYYTHHGDFARETYLDKIRRAHISHHFVDPDSTYGISSQFWDVPFGTHRKVETE